MLIVLKHCLVCCLFVATCAAAAAERNQPVFTPLDPGTQAVGISGDGAIVVGQGGGGFYWTADTGTVRIGGTSVAGISFDGSTIVGTAPDELGRDNAAIWQGGTDWSVLGSFTPDAAPCDRLLSSSWGVSGDGTVVVGLGWNGCAYAHGFRWDADLGLSDLGSLVDGRASRANAVSADGQVIIGWSDQASGFRQGAAWANGSWRWFESEYGAVGEALAVNSDGSIIVGYACGPFNQHAWTWTSEAGVQCVAGTLSNPVVTFMFAVNGDGSVIGGAEQPDISPGSRAAVLWFSGEPVSLKQYLLDRGVSEVAAWDLKSVSAVSSDGTVIAGWGFDPQFRVRGFVVALPRP
jgi:probable HAF family extracellular repeat protein